MGNAAEKRPHALPPETTDTGSGAGGNQTALHRRTVRRTAAVAVLLMMALTVWALRGTSSFRSARLDTFLHLGQIYRESGLQRFLEEKERLHDAVADALAHAKGAEREHANNIAVYLYPDLLASSNFERPVAQEDWAPLQAGIEKAPGTEESQGRLEELKANVWNYESPDRDVPQLSPEARQMLRIYESLARP